MPKKKLVYVLLLLCSLAYVPSVLAQSWPPGALSSVATTTTDTSNPPCRIISTTYVWKFTDPTGVAHAFTGSSSHFSNGGPTGQCPQGSGNLGFTGWSTDYQYYLQASGATGSITAVGGYINPKFLVLGVTYAPPGANSFVDYTKSTEVGTETTVKSSFGSTYSQSISVSVSGGIGGWLNGSVSSTASTAYSQGSNTSSSITVSKAQSLSDITPGWSNSYGPINHDYDIIWLWLNPVVRFSFSQTSGGVVTALKWNGYGYDTADQPAMDVYPVYVGWLNGDFVIPSNVRTELNRGWASAKMWPSGQTAALTNAEFQTIAQADPFWSCTPTPVSCPTTVDGARFSGPVAGQSFTYLQPPPGGNPTMQSFVETNTNANVQGQGASRGFTQTFAFEQSLGLSAFGVGLKTTLMQSNMFTSMSEWNRQISTTNTSTALFSLTGPPCVVTNSVCSPVYTGPTVFDVYQDNIYATYFFYPVR